MQLSLNYKLIITFIAGLSLPLAFQPFGLYLFAIFSPAIFFYLLHKHSGLDAFKLGYSYGFGMFGFGVYWLHVSINLFGGINLIMAIISTYLLVAFMALYIGLFAWLATKIKVESKNIYFVIVLPSLWVIVEWFRGWFLTGFPWLNLGASQTDSIFSGIAPLFGVYGVSFVIAMLAGIIYVLCLEKGKGRFMTFTFSLIIVVSCWQFKNIDWTQNKQETLNIAMIQGAIPQEQKWLPNMRIPTYERYMALTENHWKDDLIIWPETAVPAFYHDATDFLNRLREVVLYHETNFLTGIPVYNQESKEYFNSIVMLNNSDKFYHKKHLVPFGEYFPSFVQPFLRILGIPMSNFTPAKDGEFTITTDKVILGMSICYEDAYGSIVRKALPSAELLINVSNDAWFGDSIAAHQHLQIARMRAIENGRYLLRSTNTGVSAIINEKGKVIKTSPQHQQDALSGEITLFSGTTLFSQYGNGLIISIAFLLLVISYLINHLYFKNDN